MKHQLFAATIVCIATGAFAQPATEPAAPAAPSSGESLLTNGGFEQKLEGWDGSKDGGMSSAKPEAAHTGEFGLRVDDSDAVNGSSLGCPPLPSEPGKKYEVTFWARMLSGKSGSVQMHFLDAKNKALNKQGSGLEAKISIKGDQWKEYKFEGAAPPQTAFVRISVHSPKAGVSMFDVDDVVMREVRRDEK